MRPVWKKLFSDRPASVDTGERESECETPSASGKDQMLKSEKHRERFSKPPDYRSSDIRSKSKIGVYFIAETSRKDYARKEHGAKCKQARNDIPPKYSTA